jgi:apolipoprotein D and lipocalin family protein
MKKLPIALALMLLAGCAGIPQNMSAVKGFEIKKYLGTWYEIARLDHSFERGLTRVSAAYSLADDGSVAVINRGYNPAKKKWEEATGRAVFAGSADEGRLKVSFFRPFYGSYNILDLDKTDYSHSLVCGPDTSYLWILSRTPHMDKARLDRLVARAGELGFATNRLIFVEQDAGK